MSKYSVTWKCLNPIFCWPDIAESHTTKLNMLLFLGQFLLAQGSRNYADCCSKSCQGEMASKQDELAPHRQHWLRVNLGTEWLCWPVTSSPLWQAMRRCGQQSRLGRIESVLRKSPEAGGEKRQLGIIKSKWIWGGMPERDEPALPQPPAWSRSVLQSRADAAGRMRSWQPSIL